MSNQYQGKSTEQIVSDINNYDTGFCNPRKVSQYNEDYADAKECLMDRGYSAQEAEQMLRGDD